VLSALKPASRGPGVVVRLLNPTDDAHVARLRVGFPFARAVPVALDETAAGDALAVSAGAIEVEVPPHALRSVLLTA